MSFNKRRILRRAWERIQRARENARAVKDFNGPKNRQLLSQSSSDPSILCDVEFELLG